MLGRRWTRRSSTSARSRTSRTRRTYVSPDSGCHSEPRLTIPSASSPQEEVKKKLEEFKKISTYVAGAYDEDSAFQELEKHLQSIEKEYKDGKDINRIYYVRPALPLCLCLLAPC